MKAPIDKLLNGGNDIMQIEICRKCSLFTCSNCTRGLVFRRDTIEMSPEVFRAAVLSLEGWGGIVSLFGGNPTNHSRFPEICAILAELVPMERRGLWANDLAEHGALCREVFYPHARFNLNAHADTEAAAEIERWLPGKLIRASRNRPAWHGPVLMDRRDYGIDDGRWTALREDCDINRHWSGIIVERDGSPYGYFCEVASTLDGIRLENHGVPAEPGWWRHGMEHFEHQVRHCCDRGCGVPLRLKGHLDRDDTYDVSPSWRDELAKLGRKVPVAVVTHDELPTERAGILTDYMRLRSPENAR